MNKSKGSKKLVYLAIAVVIVIVAVAVVRGRGGGSNTGVPAGAEYYRNPLKVEPAPTLKADFQFGKPPVATVTVGKEKLGAVLVDWCWPTSADELACNNVGWPVNMPEKKVIKVGDVINILVPGITYKASEGHVTVNNASVYKEKVRPRRIIPVDDMTVEEKELKVSASGVSYSFDTQNLRPGDYVIAFRIAWDAPIGGDATYLIPVEIR